MRSLQWCCACCAAAPGRCKPCQAFVAHRLRWPTGAYLAAPGHQPCGQGDEGARQWHAVNILAPFTLLHAAPVNADTPENDAVPGLDPLAARRWRGLPRAASPWLHEEVAARMIPRLQWFREPPESWLHWEPVLGGLQAHGQLRAQLPQARWFVWSEQLPAALAATAEPGAGGWRLWGRRSAGASALPDGEQVAMLWANMWLHHEPQPRLLLQRWHRHLRTDGFLMFSGLGPDTLRELRSVYAQQGWTAPGHAFTDMHDWGDMLVHSGFAEPVMDMERLTLTYSSAAAVLDELRGLGRNFLAVRPAGLRGRGWRARLLQALEEGLPRDPQGRLQLTFEIIYGHACKPQPRAQRRGEQAVSVDDMRAMLRGGRR